MIREKQNSTHITIDLTGPNGNAYYLLATAKRLAKQLDYKWDEIQTKMTSSNYENLVQTFDSYFGDYVILER
jgi:hypothetical protein